MASFQVSGNTSNSVDVMSGNYRGLLVAATATTPADLTLAVMNGIQVNVTLYRRSGTYTVHSGPVLPIALAYNPGSNEGQVNQSYNALYVDWGGIVNLQPGDRLQVKTSVSGSATGQVVTTTLRSATGIEYYVPQVLNYAVNLQQVTQTIPCGDNVTKVGIVTLDDVDAITAVNFSSSIFSDNYSIPDFRAFAAEVFPFGGTNTTRNTYLIYDGPETQKTEVTCTVDTAQTAITYVVSFAGIRTKESTENAIRLSNKIADSITSQYL